MLGPIPPGAYEVVATKTGCKNVPGDDGTFRFVTTANVSAATLTGVVVKIVPQ